VFAALVPASRRRGVKARPDFASGRRASGADPQLQQALRSFIGQPLGQCGEESPVRDRFVGGRELSNAIINRSRR
jgi:hypothetical protein